MRATLALAAALAGWAGLATGCANAPSASGASGSSAPTPPRPAPPLVDGEPDASGAADTPTAAPAAAPTARRDARAPVAFVDGVPIDATALLEQWLHADGIELGQHVDALVNERLAQIDGAHIGLELSDELVERRYQEAREQAETALRRGGEPVTLESYVSDHLGLDPAAYLVRLRRDCGEQLLLERVVRAFTLGCERVEGRVIVVEDPAAADEVRAALAAGADFAALAREKSVDATRTEGGRVYAVVRAEDSPLAELAFRTPIGEVGGPLEQGTRHLFLKVEARPEPRQGRWSDLAAEVERSLEADPVTEPEFLQWKASAERRHEIDLRPLYELVGEPLPARARR